MSGLPDIGINILKSAAADLSGRVSKHARHNPQPSFETAPLRHPDQDEA
jgi:hypothetical protein